MPPQNKWFPISSTIVIEDLWVLAISFAMKAQKLTIADIPITCHRLQVHKTDIDWLLTCDHGVNPLGLKRKVNHFLNPDYAADMNQWIMTFRQHHDELIQLVRQHSFDFLSEYQDLPLRDFTIRFDNWVQLWFPSLYPLHPYTEALRSYTHYFMYENDGTNNASLKAVWFHLWASFKPSHGGSWKNYSDMWVMTKELEQYEWEGAGI